MTTPTGTITMLDVIEELDGSPTPRTITLNDADVRGLAGVPSGAISMDDLRGKSSTTPGVVLFGQNGYSNDERVYIIFNTNGVLQRGGYSAGSSDTWLQSGTEIELNKVYTFRIPISDPNYSSRGNSGSASVTQRTDATYRYYDVTFTALGQTFRFQYFTPSGTDHTTTVRMQAPNNTSADTYTLTPWSI